MCILINSFVLSVLLPQKKILKILDKKICSFNTITLNPQWLNVWLSVDWTLLGILKALFTQNILTYNIAILRLKAIAIKNKKTFFCQNIVVKFQNLVK